MILSKISKKNSSKKINKHQTFKLNLSENERLFLQNLTVKKPISLTLNGLYKYDKLIEETIQRGISGTKTQHNHLKTLIKKIIQEFLELTGKNSALIHLRIRKKNNLFKIPRWHQDDRYFPGQLESSIKLVSTLKGPPTLISTWNQRAIDTIEKFYKKSSQVPVGTKEWKELDLKERQQVSEILTPEIGDYDSSYTYVHGKYATFHSEPDINEDRIFLAILPADKEDLKKCRQKTRVY